MGEMWGAGRETIVLVEVLSCLDSLTFCTRMPRCCTTWCGEKTGNQTERSNWTALKKVSQKNEVNRKIQLSSLYPTYSPTHSHTHTPKKRSVAEIVILLVVTRLPQMNNTGQDAQSRIGVARLVVLWRKSSGEHSRLGHTHICTYRIGKGREKGTEGNWDADMMLLQCIHLCCEYQITKNQCYTCKCFTASV